MSDFLVLCLLDVQELLHVHGWVLEIHGQLFHVFEQHSLVSIELLTT